MMNNTKMSLAAVLAAASLGQARRLPVDEPEVFSLNDNSDFANWIANNNVDYRGAREFRMRMRNYQIADTVIRQKNYEADLSELPDAVRLAHNRFSDRTIDEKAMAMGARFPNHELNQGTASNEDYTLRGSDSARGYSVSVRPENIDWIKAGKVSPVKDQGYCGSCWSFTAMTVLESQIAIAEDTRPVRLSEQQALDCSHYYDNDQAYYNWGCQGGWPGDTWNYARDKGMMTYDNYQYVGYEQNCAYQNQPNVTFDIAANEMLNGWETSHPLEIFRALKEQGPLSIALQSNCDSFMYYSSGMLRESDCTYTQLDHVIVLTGYQLLRSAPYVSQYEKTNSWGRYTTAEDPEGGCKGENETYVPNLDYCTWDTVELREETHSGAAFWTAINSWGRSWGKNGLVHIAVQQGNGFQGMNNFVERLQIDNIRIRN